MNKKNILQNIIFIITIALLIGIRFIHSTVSFGVIMMYILYMIFLIIYAFDIKKKNEILNDKTYSLLIILVCILIDIILLRSMFDTNIISVGFLNYIDESYQMIFLKSNTILINISVILLLCYRLTYMINLPKISIQINLKK